MILVAGATGNVGRNVVSELLDAGIAVRGLTRNPNTAELPESVQVARGDLSRLDTLKSALRRDIDGAFLVWPLPTAKAASGVIDLMAAHTNRIVYLSSLSVRDDLDRQLDPISAFHAEIERLIKQSGMRWTFLRPSGFATNTLVWAPQIRDTGIVRWPHGGARRSLIDERDIAAVAARALLSAGHTEATHLLTGPNVLTQVEQVNIIGEAIGRHLRYEEVPTSRARQALLRAWGLPGIAARLLPPTALPRQMADGALGALAKMTTDPEPVTNSVQELTGTPARTFQEWARAHAQDFQ